MNLFNKLRQEKSYIKSPYIFELHYQYSIIDKLSNMEESIIKNELIDISYGSFENFLILLEIIDLDFFNIEFFYEKLERSFIYPHDRGTEKIKNEKVIKIVEEDFRLQCKRMYRRLRKINKLKNKFGD